MFLRNAWYVAAWPREVTEKPLARTILDEPVVLFRAKAGNAVALHDMCCHRALPLSMGRIVGERLARRPDDPLGERLGVARPDVLRQRIVGKVGRRQRRPGAAAAAPIAGPAQALQSANAALYRLAVETVSVLKQVGLSMLRLGDGEAAAGLHAWASRAFEPLLRLLAQQRSLQLLRRMQATGGPQAGAAAVGEGKVVGDARGGGGVAEAAALPVVDEEDVDLPFGGAKATLPSSSSENKGPCFAPSAHAAASVEAQPLAWLHALSLQALGKYEHAVRQYTTFLQMDAWDPVPQPPVAPDVPPSGTHAGGHASATPTPGPASQSPSQQSQDALAVHSGVRRYVAERLAECYVSVADWGGLHALASEHHGRARADPAGHGVWWGPLAQQMGQHFAMASYDLAPGPAAVDIKVWARMGGAPTREDHACWPPWDVSGSGVKQALVWKLCI